MNWMLVLLLFNVQTGELTTHTETLYPSQKDCTDRGDFDTTNAQYPAGFKASYICLPDKAFFPPEGEPKKGKKVLGIL